MREPTAKQSRTLATLAGDDGYTITGGMDAMVAVVPDGDYYPINMDPRAVVAFIHGARAWVAVVPDGDYYPINIGARRTPPVGRELGPHPAGQGVAA